MSRIFFDHCVPKRLRRYLVAEHQVQTAYQKLWHEKKNGELLTLVAKEFDVFLTADRNIRYQQNLSAHPLGLVILVARDNKYETLAPLMPKVLAVLEKISPGEIVEVL